MPLANYQIMVIDPVTGGVLRVFDSTSITSLRYNRILNDVGTLALALPGNLNNYNAFPLDAMVEIQRTDPVTGALVVEDTYFARMRQRYIEGNEERLAIGGVSLNHLLLRRLVDPNADPLIAGGYSTKAGLAGNVIAEYVAEQCTDVGLLLNRAFPGFSIPGVTDAGEGAGARLRFEGLLESVQALASQGGIDFYIYRTSGANTEMFIGIQGADKTKTANYLVNPWVGLNPKRGNLTEPSLLNDRKDEQNLVYVLAQGKGRGRRLMRLLGTGVGDSPFNRIEYVLDSRNIQRGDLLAMLTAGQADLNSKRKQVVFSYQPTGKEPGNVYKLDWDLGDKLTVIWDSVERDVRVTNVEISIDESGEEITTTVENLDYVS